MNSTMNCSRGIMFNSFFVVQDIFYFDKRIIGLIIRKLVDPEHLAF